MICKVTKKKKKRTIDIAVKTSCQLSDPVPMGRESMVSQFTSPDIRNTF